MPAHTILQLIHDANGALALVAHAPTAIADRGDVGRCTLNPPNWAAAKGVRAHGSHLAQELRKAHKSIDEAFAGVLKTGVNDAHALYFKIGHFQEDQQYWETVFDGGDFFALRPKPLLSIGRMPGTTTAPPHPVRHFRPPLRIMAFLSALPLSARVEWDNLLRAAKDARESGLDVELVLRIGEPDLLEEIEEAILGEGLDFVTVQGIPMIPVDFAADIRKANPHLLHLFCHGVSQGVGTKFLSLATIPDWLNHAVAGTDPPQPLILTAEHFANLPVWLVTLNCCEGGKPPVGGRSFAYDLVADEGIPAAIGVLEEFQQTDAHVLSERLYPEILKLMDEVARSAPGTTREISWPAVLAICRQVLSTTPTGTDRDIDRRWALPVLYVSQPTFHVMNDGAAGAPFGFAPVPVDDGDAGPPKVDLSMIKRIQEVAGFLKANPQMPKALRQKIIDDILGDVPEEFRPDTSGEFKESAAVDEE
jgi:hypothetical protein